jgi:hypothetical protein
VTIQLTSVHEALHAVSSAAFLCSVPNVWGVRVAIGLTARVDGEGHCATLLPPHLNHIVHQPTLTAWSACGPMGQLSGPAEIGRAIAERRYDFLSSDDIEIAERIPAMDQFLAATVAHLWRARLPVDGPVALHRILMDRDFLFHQPTLPLTAFCSGELAAKLKREARALMFSHLPAHACVGRAPYAHSRSMAA